MPVIVQFDIPVKRKAEFEQHMTVTAKPATVGSWNWISDTEAHWRPKTYWKSGTKVHVDVDVNGLNAGNGIYGQMNREVDFKIGQSVIMKADLAHRPDEGHDQRQAGPHDPDHRRQAAASRPEAAPS